MKTPAMGQSAPNLPIFDSSDPIYPKLFYRHRWREYNDRFGFPFTKGSMQNYDSEGVGPERLTIAGKVAYRIEPLFAWLNGHVAQ